MKTLFVFIQMGDFSRASNRCSWINKKRSLFGQKRKKLGAADEDALCLHSDEPIFLELLTGVAGLIKSGACSVG
ncbi:hypothetical protein BALCAV_0206755 [Alkalihalobacillus alcalophilus ATCC 27647 = CGMCC 1.3604]|uniref:Uncharacterized protein n=1 Tax=Alkalihalobacillus alcalophilus ATCC 27647 = CGMCC 1.3604 TaxID=1218173 RepID=A0A094XGR1_ALKAL|nr:hypothetical protein BALCAV_0206755 [Alkalihalobacillus alcalophilus ATCC 27647 = CGMCC 1.3604]